MTEELKPCPFCGQEPDAIYLEDDQCVVKCCDPDCCGWQIATADVCWNTRADLAAPTDAEVREAFERYYSCGDPLIDGESLARNSDGTYETALARLCFKWFGKGRAALQSKATARPSREVVEILDQIRKSGFVSYTGEKPHVLAVKAIALLEGGE